MVNAALQVDGAAAERARSRRDRRAARRVGVGRGGRECAGRGRAGGAGGPPGAVAEAPWSVAEWAVAPRFDNPRATVLVLVLG